MPKPSGIADLSPVEQSVLRDLQVMTYEETSRKHDWSRGRIYDLALRAGARKTEARIQERQSDRRARQR